MSSDTFREHNDPNAFTVWERLGISKHLGEVYSTKRLFEQMETVGVSFDGAQVLDLGAGSGFQTRLVTGYGANVIGVDYNSELIQSASRRQNPSVESLPSFVLADAQGLPFKPDSFDIVIAEQILTLLRDPYSVIEQVHGLMRSGGIIGINEMYLDEQMPYQIRLLIGGSNSVFIRGFNGLSNPQVMGHFLEGKGFQIVAQDILPFDLREQLKGYNEIDGAKAHILATLKGLADNGTRKALIELGTRMPFVLPYLRIGLTTARRIK